MHVDLYPCRVHEQIYLDATLTLTGDIEPRRTGMVRTMHRRSRDHDFVLFRSLSERIAILLIQIPELPRIY